MITSLVELGQTPFEIVQRKVDEAPMVSDVTPDVGEAGVVTEAVPATTDHKAVPTTGAFPASVAVVVLHSVWLGPASATVGEAFTVIVTSSVEGAQEPLEIVQRSTEEAPIVSPVTPEVANAGVVTTAVPDTTDHTPVPEAGTLPARVAVVVLQRV